MGNGFRVCLIEGRGFCSLQEMIGGGFNAIRTCKSLENTCCVKVALIVYYFSPETRPLISKQVAEEAPEIIYEQDAEQEDAGSLPTFGYSNVSRNNSVPNSRHNSLPRKKPSIWDENALDATHKSLRSSSSKASSIISIETVSDSFAQNLQRK